MKKIMMLLAVLVMAGCSTKFMDNAYVGDINGRTLVIFKDSVQNGVQYYRPQFPSDCQVEFAYGFDETSTTCRIRESRLSNIHSFNEHKTHAPHNQKRVVDNPYKYVTMNE